MNTREWALIAFTILNQMAVGSFLILGIVHTYALRKKGMEQADQLSDRALLSIIPIVGLALIASLFHLGNPINAPRAINNLGTSWLSREILSDLIFAGLALVFAIMQWRKIASFAVRNVIAWITAIVGLGFIYVMSSAYLLPTEPSWNTLATPVTFYSTAFLLGSLAMGVAFVANYAYVQRHNPGCASDQCELMRDAVRGISISAIVFLGIELITIPLYVTHLATGVQAGQSSLQLMVGSFSLVFVLRLALGFIGAGIFGVFLYRNAVSAGREKVLGYLVYSAFTLVLVAEVLGRFLFYATRVRIGI
jgi:anaerobic dimethyl sulfoxide reductase subunit C (anchor subunit)